MDNIHITRTYVTDDSGNTIGYVRVNLFAKPGELPWYAHVRKTSDGRPVGRAASKEEAIELVRNYYDNNPVSTRTEKGQGNGTQANRTNQGRNKVATSSRKPQSAGYDAR